MRSIILPLLVYGLLTVLAGCSASEKERDGVLVSQLGSEDRAVRSRAQERLVLQGDKAVKELKQYLRDETSPLRGRMSAVNILKRIGTRQAAAALVAYLRDVANQWGKRQEPLALTVASADGLSTITGIESSVAKSFVGRHYLGASDLNHDLHKWAQWVHDFE